MCFCSCLGLVNKKSVSIQPGGEGLSVTLATTKTKKQNKPSSLYNRSVMKKEFRKMAKAVTNQVAALDLAFAFDGAHLIRFL